jgi:DNA modification methylase
LRDVFQFARELTWPHPTVKPQDLLRALIGSCTTEGDLVIDPTAGIASTLVAAQATRRRFWGCESDDNWHQVGCKRLLEGMSDQT